MADLYGARPWKGRLWRSGGQRSRSQEVEVRFRRVVEALFSTALSQVSFLVASLSNILMTFVFSQRSIFWYTCWSRRRGWWWRRQILFLRVLQDAAVAAAASSHRSFIDEYFGGEYETTYLFVTAWKCLLIVCLVILVASTVLVVLFFSKEKQKILAVITDYIHSSASQV